MRILWTHNFDPSIPGKGSFMYTTADGLRARGLDVTLEYLGNLRSPVQLLAARRRVSRIAVNFDLVHAQFGSACALATAAARAIPKVVTLRGSDWNNYGSSLGFLYWHTRLSSLMTRTSLRHYDCIISVSRREARDIMRAAPQARFEVLPSPIDLTRFVPLDRRAARARLGFPDNKEKWVLFNALNVDNPVKRFALARRAFEIASDRCAPLRLRIATGLTQEQLPMFVAACDVIVCTSEYEGWPNSVKEALACNVPFVATDVSDLRDVAARVPNCKVTSDDPEEIADAICAVLATGQATQLREEVAWMGQEHASARLLEIYRSLIESRQQKTGAARSAQVTH